MLVLVVGLKCGTPKTQYVPNVKNIVILKNPRINRGFFISGTSGTSGTSGSPDVESCLANVDRDSRCLGVNCQTILSGVFRDLGRIMIILTIIFWNIILLVVYLNSKF
jgi:hypothetical protein